jgi:hypothetical protein
MKSTGTKLTISAEGEKTPTPTITKIADIVEASEYAGATDETATAVESKRLSSSARSWTPSSASGTGAPKGPMTSCSDMCSPLLARRPLRPGFAA